MQIAGTTAGRSDGGRFAGGRREESARLLKSASVMLVGLASLMLAGCRDTWRTPPPVDEATFRQQHEEWRAYRRERLLTPPDGPLLWIGLWALPEGTSLFGADSTVPIVFPPDRSPPVAGRFVRTGMRVVIEPAVGVHVRDADGEPVSGPYWMRSDADSGTTDLHLGALGLRIHEVGERVWLRVWDEQHASRTTFRGAPFYPVSLRWRLAARLEPFREPRDYRIADMAGGVQEYSAPGRLAFRVEGRTHYLTPFLEPGQNRYWILFADSTNASETYPAGRYLLVPLADSAGWTTIDFNRAYGPPCAFTSFATCPLPPWENRLDLAVTAGELRPH